MLGTKNQTCTRKTHALLNVQDCRVGRSSRQRALSPCQTKCPHSEFDHNMSEVVYVVRAQVGALIARTQDWTLKPARAFIRGRQAERAATAAAQAKEDRATARRMLGGFRQTADPDEVQHMQTKRFHIMYTCYEAVEAKDGGLCPGTKHKHVSTGTQVN